MKHRPPESKYFARTVMYARQGDAVVLVDVANGRKTKPLDAWLGRVFLLADGSHTVDELKQFVSRQYGGSPPANLEATLDSVLERLVDAKVIALVEERVGLPYYLSRSADEQDLDEARRLMQEDGFEQCSLPQGLSRSADRLLH